MDMEQFKKELDALNGWAFKEGLNAIYKSFKFKNFAEAWNFMNEVANIAERQNHHPEWSNLYNIVDITLTTHDIGGVGDKDIKMARAIDALD